MELLLIKHATCPDCGARTVEESCRHAHCNGQGFERRTFDCGCILAWSPNFGRLEVERSCPNSKSVLEENAERSDLEAKIMRTIRAASVSDQTKHFWHSRINWDTPALADVDFRKTQSV